MDDFQNLRKQLNAAVEDVIEAGVRHAQAQESIKAAEVILIPCYIQLLHLHVPR